MTALAAWIVGKPLNILAVAVVVLVGHFLVRAAGIGSGRHPKSLLVLAVAWGGFALWEWLVLLRTPEANIRVDLLVIVPVLAVVSIWLVIRAFR